MCSRKMDALERPQPTQQTPAVGEFQPTTRRWWAVCPMAPRPESTMWLTTNRVQDWPDLPAGSWSWLWSAFERGMGKGPSRLFVWSGTKVLHASDLPVRKLQHGRLKPAVDSRLPTSAGDSFLAPAHPVFFRLDRCSRGTASYPIYPCPLILSRHALVRPQRPCRRDKLALAHPKPGSMGGKSSQHLDVSMALPSRYARHDEIVSLST